MLEERKWRSFEVVELTPGLQISFLESHPDLCVLEITDITLGDVNRVSYKAVATGIEQMFNITKEDPIFLGRDDIRDMRLRRDLDQKGSGIDKVSSDHFLIKMEDGKILCRHIGRNQASMLSPPILNKGAAFAAIKEHNATIGGRFRWGKGAFDQVAKVLGKDQSPRAIVAEAFAGVKELASRIKSVERIEVGEGDEKQWAYAIEFKKDNSKRKDAAPLGIKRDHILRGKDARGVRYWVIPEIVIVASKIGPSLKGKVPEYELPKLRKDTKPDIPIAKELLEDGPMVKKVQEGRLGSGQERGI